MLDSLIFIRDGELVSYDTQGQTAIAGLTTDAVYYCCVKNSTTVSLHKNYQEAISGVSTIGLTNYGVGIQRLKCQSKKRIISSVSIGHNGSGYTNRLTSITSAGINTSNNTINIKNHRYDTGELLRYDTKGTSISGLTTLTDYYVTKVNGDSIKLSAVGVGSTAANFYLRKENGIERFMNFCKSDVELNKYLQKDETKMKNIFKIKPLPGFKPSTPVVFCGLYPIDASDYDHLKDSINKLKLTETAKTETPPIKLCSASVIILSSHLGYIGLKNV